MGCISAGMSHVFNVIIGADPEGSPDQLHSEAAASSENDDPTWINGE